MRILLDQAGLPWEEAWARKAILNVGLSGRFARDRTIAEYAAESWWVEPARCRKPPPSHWRQGLCPLVSTTMGDAIPSR
jgi:Carbohydrate phosphorylase